MLERRREYFLSSFAAAAAGGGGGGGGSSDAERAIDLEREELSSRAALLSSTPPFLLFSVNVFRPLPLRRPPEKKIKRSFLLLLPKSQFLLDSLCLKIGAAKKVMQDFQHARL